MPRRLLLLGAGPAHLRVLAAFARHPLPSAEVALLTPDAQAVPPALLPDFVAANRDVLQCRVDTAALAAAAGATWVHARVERFDAASRQVTLSDGRVFDADLVSIDEPGEVDRDALPGARELAIALHPAASFVVLFGALLALAEEKPLDLVVIGGGVPPLELALALSERLGGWGGRGSPPERARMAWVAGPDGLLPGWPAAARRAAASALVRARIAVFHEPCRALQPGAAVLASGARLACDAAVLATPPQPPAWLSKCGLALDDAGALVVTDHLHTAAHPAVFGPGPAAGVAVVDLATQLRQAVAAAPLRPVTSHSPSLRWLRIGRGRAAVVWGQLAMTGLVPGAWRLHRLGPVAGLAAHAVSRPA